MPPRRSTFRALLQSSFDSRKLAKPGFSMRAFAQFLKIPPTTLKYLLDGSRQPSAPTLKQIAERLSWEPRTVESIRVELHGERTAGRLKAPEVLFNNASLVSDVANMALLTLARAPKISANVTELSKRLDVTESRVSRALSTLMRLKLVVIEDGYLRAIEKLPHVTIEDSDIAPYRQTMLKRAEHWVDADDLSGAVNLNFHLMLDDADVRRLADLVNGFRRRLAKEFPPSRDKNLYSSILTIFPFAENEANHRRGSGRRK